MKKLFLALVLAVGVQLAGAPAGWAGDNAFQRQEPKGAHTKGGRGSTKNKHQKANGRRQREQAAATRRQFEAKKASTRRQQAAKQVRAAAKKQGGRRR
jgi:hypothetical protein